MEPESRPVRVLLVDDHSIMREGLESMLRGSDGFQVVDLARDGDEAARAAAELSPDVVVMDVMMPDKDGVEACREIMDASPDARVIVLTASTEEDAVIEAVADGATRYFRLGICAGLAQPRRSRNAGMPSLGRSETRGSSSIRCRGSWRMVQRWPRVANTNRASIQAKPSPMHRRGPPPKG